MTRLSPASQPASSEAEPQTTGTMGWGVEVVRGDAPATAEDAHEEHQRRLRRQ